MASAQQPVQQILDAMSPVNRVEPRDCYHVA